MFPKNRINIIYRLLCLLSYIVVILVTNNIRTIIVLTAAFVFLALCEISFRNIELFIMTIVFFVISYFWGNYILLKIILILDYLLYYLDTSYYRVIEDEKLDENHYIRFKRNKKKKKGSNNITAVFLTVHLVILFLAILVG